jgi:hypothetical protein
VLLAGSELSHGKRREGEGAELSFLLLRVEEKQGAPMEQGGRKLAPAMDVPAASQKGGAPMGASPTAPGRSEQGRGGWLSALDAAREGDAMEALPCVLDASRRWKKGRLHLPARWRGRAGRCCVREEERSRGAAFGTCAKGRKAEKSGRHGWRKLPAP